MSLLSQFVAHISDFEVSFKPLLTTESILAGILAFVLIATLSKKKR